MVIKTNCCGLNVREDGVAYESIIIISIDLLLIPEKYIQTIVNKITVDKNVDKEMKDYLDDNLFETGEDQFFDFDK